MSKRAYFGTDGIRGEANRFPMTAEVALRCGMAAGKLFMAQGDPEAATRLRASARAFAECGAPLAACRARLALARSLEQSEQYGIRLLGFLDDEPAQPVRISQVDGRDEYNCGALKARMLADHSGKFEPVGFRHGNVGQHHRDIVSKQLFKRFAG